MRLSNHALAAVLAVPLALACNNKDVKAAEGQPVQATTKAEPAGTIADNSAKPAGAANAAVPTAAPAKRRGNKQYAVVARPVNIKVGGKTVAHLVIEPAKGLKFNKDFPTSFIVSAGRHAKCDKKKLSKRAGDVKVDGKKGKVAIPLTALAAGSGDLSIMGNFSVCSDEQCYVLRGQQLALNVTVK